ncbi:hypothetical protein [Rufibacter roseus]|uniref:HTTM-like domain-containing protein n=1 Tax=Rufibacter roseus TaxID=1567108 RepID=A0ABW2DL65_9BACT|nr:hypothetical protein [Rufibacter roseus]
MALFYNKLKKVYKTEVPSEGLAVFRIAYASVLFFEIVQMFYFRKLIFDPIPYIEYAEINLTFVLICWLIALLSLALGLFTRYCTIINLVLSLGTFSVFRTYEYHLDWSLIGVNFLLPFLPLSKSLSLDNVLNNKLGTGSKSFNMNTSLLYYLLPPLVGIGLIYFDSIFWKFASPMWLKGLGFWLPTSLPQNTYMDLSFVLNIKPISLFLGYLTLIFELVFIFLIWSKRARPILLIIGVGLHLGILIAYPIPLFALGITSIYTLLVPPSFWRNLFNLKANQENLQNHDKEEPSPKCFSTSTVTAINNIKFKFIYGFIIYCIVAQSLCILNTPLIGKTFGLIGLHDVNNKIISITQPLLTLNKQILGIANHGVFLDQHFIGYNHLIAVTYVDDENKKEVWLPIITPKGQVSYYNTGKQWAKWTWRTNKTKIEQELLAKGIEKFTAFWAHKNNVELDSATFKVKVKKIIIPTEWEKDFLKDQMDNPWTTVGEATWVNNKFSANIPIIENL